MPSAHAQPDTLFVRVSDDRLTAELCIPPAVHAAVITLDTARRLVEAQKIPWTSQVAEAVETLLATPRPPTGLHTAVIARGVAPLPGDHGRIDWLADQHKPPHDAPVLSHYERSAFVFVEPGQVIARITPPQPGSPGRDVTGAEIPATPGQPVELQPDESILRKPNGELVAQRHGRLVRSRNAARIQELLEVRAVDFSTGNIDFRGSILIRDGVKDRFVVKATEGIEVHGLVEAAEFHCGGDLVLEGGFAGRDLGRATVGGNFNARYLDAVHAEVRGDLTVAREVINCELTVHGNADVARGAIIGGKTLVAKTLRVGTLGSPGGVATEVFIGRVPRLDPMLAQLEHLRRDYLREIDAIRKKRQMIDAFTPATRDSDTNRRRLSKFVDLLEPLEHQLQRASLAIDALRAKIAELRVIDVHVEKALHEGVILCDAGKCYRIFQPLLGPLTIALDRDGVLVFRTPTGHNQPLAAIAEPVAEPRAAA